MYVDSIKKKLQENIIQSIAYYTKKCNKCKEHEKSIIIMCYMHNYKLQELYCMPPVRVSCKNQKKENLIY